MWIGIINECDLDTETFGLDKIHARGGTRKFDNAIVYYGQREWRIDKEYKTKKLFIIDYSQQIIFFEKNRVPVAWVRISDIIKEQKNNYDADIEDTKVIIKQQENSNQENDSSVRLYYICEVDTAIDGFYVQKYPLYHYQRERVPDF